MRKNGYRLTDSSLCRLKEVIENRYGSMPSYRLAEQMEMSKDTLRRILQEDPHVPTVSLDTLQKFAGVVEFDLQPGDYEYARAGFITSNIINPFIWRDCIRDPSAFWGRERELNRLRQFVHAGTSYHIIGEKRVGKSSLLRQFCHNVKIEDGAAVAFLDMNDVRTHTPMGMLKMIADSFGWEKTPQDEPEFNQILVDNLEEGKPHIICFDHFERYSDRLEDAFEMSFWDNMRWVGTQGISMFTASVKPLDSILSASGKTSPFYNIFLQMKLLPFTPQEAKGFVQLRRDGIPPFTEDETKEIVEKSRCHPLALQILCYYILQAKIENDPASPVNAAHEAETEIERQIKGWGK